MFGSGQKYEGHWEKGKKHGWSIYTVETGGLEGSVHAHTQGFAGTAYGL